MIRWLAYTAAFVAVVAFWAWSVIDVLATPRPSVRNLPKVAWLAVVVFALPVGGVVWLLLGRPEGAGPWPGGRSGPGGGARGSSAGGAGPRRRSPRRAEPPPPPPDRVVTDRQSAELDRQLDEWLAQQSGEGGPETPDAADEPGAGGEGRA